MIRYFARIKVILRLMLLTRNANRCARCAYCASAHLFILPFLASWGCYDIAMVYSHAFDSSHHSFAFVLVIHSWEPKHGGLGGLCRRGADLPLLEDRIAEPGILALRYADPLVERVRPCYKFMLVHRIAAGSSFLPVWIIQHRRWKAGGI